MRKAARNSLVAGLGIAAVGSILVAQKRKRANEADATSGYGSMPAQGGAGDETPGNVIGTMTIEEMTIEERQAEDRLSE
jgi:hypothetical protein